MKLKSGEEGLKKPNKRAPEAEEEEEETAEVEEAGEKGGELLSPETTDQEPPELLAPKGQQDQHHFLRSSVRPHSKRQRRDSCSNGKGAAAAATAKSKGIPTPGHCTTPYV